MAKAISMVIGEVRFSYLHVFEPWSADGTSENYTASLLIDKKDTTLVSRINDAIK